MSGPSRVVALLLAAVVLTGCGGGGAEGGASPTPKVPADGALAVSLGTQVEAGPEAELKAVAATRDLATGDLVRTDPTGLAELRFPDGSLTRLASTEQMTLTELTAAAVQRTRQKLTIGQTWHKVSAITAPGGAYEVATPVGVAAVRGTVFGLTCVAGPSCTLTVLEGKVEFTPTGKAPVLVEPFQRLTVTAAGADAPRAVPAALVRADPWLSANVDRDRLGALLDQAPAAIPADTKLALNGVFRGEQTVLRTVNTDLVAGQVLPINVTLTTPCDALPCTGTMVSDLSGAIYTTVWDGQTLTARNERTEACTTSTGAVVDPTGWRYVREVRLQPVIGSTPTQLSGPATAVGVRSRTAGCAFPSITADTASQMSFTRAP
jgi:hypothetical protein